MSKKDKKASPWRDPDGTVTKVRVIANGHDITDEVNYIDWLDQHYDAASNTWSTKTDDKDEIFAAIHATIEQSLMLILDLQKRVAEIEAASGNERAKAYLSDFPSVLERLGVEAA